MYDNFGVYFRTRTQPAYPFTSQIARTHWVRQFNQRSDRQPTLTSASSKVQLETTAEWEQLIP